MSYKPQGAVIFVGNGRYKLRFGLFVQSSVGKLGPKLVCPDHVHSFPVPSLETLEEASARCKKFFKNSFSKLFLKFFTESSRAAFRTIRMTTVGLWAHSSDGTLEKGKRLGVEDHGTKQPLKSMSDTSLKAQLPTVTKEQTTNFRVPSCGQSRKDCFRKQSRTLCPSRYTIAHHERCMLLHDLCYARYQQ